MPNRILKESICTSDTIDQLSWFDEAVFYRLIVNCDDFGRFDGRGEVLKSRLFPLKEGRVTVKSVTESINRLATVGLVIPYECDGRPYLQLATWDKHQQRRAKYSKYPAREDARKQLISDDVNCPRIREPIIEEPIIEEPIIEEPIIEEPIIEEPIIEEPGIGEPGIGEPGIGERSAREDALAGLDGALRERLEEWLRYKAERREAYRPTGLRSLAREVKSKRASYSDAQICDLIAQCMSNGWKGIIWDKLERPAAPGRRNPPARTGQHSSLDMEKLHALLHRSPDGRTP